MAKQPAADTYDAKAHRTTERAKASGQHKTTIRLTRAIRAPKPPTTTNRKGK